MLLLLLLLNLDGPEIKAENLTLQSSTMNETKTIICARDLVSNPPATIIWTNPRGEIVINNSRYSYQSLISGPADVTLTIIGVNEKDEGVWNCNISVKDGENEIGRKDIKIKLYIGGVGYTVIRMIVITIIHQSIETLIKLALDNSSTIFGLAVAFIAIMLTFIILYYQSMKMIGKPMNLKLSDVGCDSITLEWTKPKQGGKHVTSYTIFCRSSDDPVSQWQSKMTTNKEKVKITNLNPQTCYSFKVRPEFGFMHGNESGVTDPIKTKPKYLGRSNNCKPVATHVTQNSVCLTWGEPEFGADQVVRYNIFYQSTENNQDQWNKHVVEGSIINCRIDRLAPETKYIFKVCPESKFGSGPESDVSDEIITGKVLSKRAKKISQRVSGTFSPELYNLKMKMYAEGMRYVLGEPSSNQADEKVLLLVGATGAGKTTLLNGIVNYVLGVQLEDNFRFQLDLKTDVSHAQSQTSKVTAYTFYPMDGSQLPYPLTIIDTPGFGDTKSVSFNKVLLQQILDIVSIEDEHSIKHINGIAVVIQASSVRLSQTQRYIFTSISKVFGRDVESNMFLMITFADGQDPPVLDAVKEADIPYERFFKFNNYALFEKPATEGFPQLYWNFCMESFKTFFSVLESIKPVNVQLTKEALIERLHLEQLVEGLQCNINSGLDKISALQMEEKLLKEKAMPYEMEINENFTYSVTVTKRKRVELLNQRALNCHNCFTTCHFPCERKDDDIYDCIVMDNHDPSFVRCTICLSTCKWNMHKLQSFRYESIKQIEVRTIKALKVRYDEAKSHQEKAKSTITILEEELFKLQQDVMIKIKHARKCQECLNEIALKPEAVTEAGYIDILIEEEKNEASEGFMKRIEVLEDLKRATKLPAQLNKMNSMPPKEFMKDWWAKFRQGTSTMSCLILLVHAGFIIL